MTVSKTNDFDGPYTGNGATTDFPFTFSCGTEAEVVVIQGGDFITSGFSVVLNANGNGGVVSFDIAPVEADGSIFIASMPTFTQNTSFENAGAFLPQSHDQALDQLTRQNIFLRGLLNRTILMPIGDVGGQLPSAAERAGKFQAYGASGEPIVSNGPGEDGGLRADLAEDTGSSLSGFKQTHLHALGRSVQDRLRETVSIYDFAGADDVERLVNALTDLPDGATLVFPAGRETVINRLVKIGDDGGTAADVAVAKNIRIEAHGHTFRYTATGARLEFNAPISSINALSANYAKGSRTLRIYHAGAQLADYQRNSWIKIVSNALDGWNRNEGTALNQYRLGEFAKIQKVVDNGDGTATLTLYNPLKFVRGFTNTGDAENLTEGDTYTIANNARVVALKLDNFSWEGGTITCDNPALGVGGWNTRALLRLQGFMRPHLDRIRLGTGAGKGIELAGCVAFTVNALHINRLPDYAEQLANEGIATSYLGYGVAVAGCWGGLINDLVGRDCRHGVTESNTTMLADSASYGILMATGRTYGTHIDNPRVEGQYSSAVDTHHGAHAWTISNAVILGTQANYGISLRGPGHTVIAPHIIGERGIQVFSEYANDGGGDLPALNGNANKYMSSAKVIGGNIDCTIEALSAGVAYITVEGGLRIRCRTHNVFTADGGVIDFSSGRVEVEVTGESRAGTVLGDAYERAIFYGGDAAAQYGVTWKPGFRVRIGAVVEIDASAAIDTPTMNIFGQEQSPVSTTATAVIEGGLSVTVPAAGMGPTFANGVKYQVFKSAVFEVLGNATLVASHPRWEQGKVRLANLAQSTPQTVYTINDVVGGTTGLWATVKVYAQDHASVPASLVAEYQIIDSFAASSTVEATFLLSSDTTNFEANSNIDLTSTEVTAGKIGLSYKDGRVTVRHNKAGIILEDMFFEFTIHRQPPLS